MPTPYETLKAHFESAEWNFEAHDDAQVLSTGFPGTNAQFEAMIAIDEGDDLIQCISFLPSNIPEASHAHVAEFVCRANYGLKVGKFEFDLSDGQIRFQTYAPFIQGDLHDDIIRRVCGLNFAMIDRYYPGFMKVIFASTPPKDAVAEIQATFADNETAT